MRMYDNGIYREMTAEEVAEYRKQQAITAAEEKYRPFTAQEVTERLITAQINTLTVDDATALRMMQFYPAWEVSTAYTAGYKVTYKDKLYKCLQAHTSQADWTPDTAASLWTVINEEHEGTEYDPIPYDGNMALENGKYYKQDDITYRCTRDTVNPVYNQLSELVGLYVEVV